MISFDVGLLGCDRLLYFAVGSDFPLAYCYDSQNTQASLITFAFIIVVSSDYRINMLESLKRQPKTKSEWRLITFRYRQIVV